MLLATAFTPPPSPLYSGIIILTPSPRPFLLLPDVLGKKAKEPKTTPEVRAECEKIARLADTYSKEELAEIIERFNIKSPTTGNDLSAPVDFNMMFATSIGPTGDLPG